MPLAMVREDFDTGDTELTIFSEAFQIADCYPPKSGKIS